MALFNRRNPECTNLVRLNWQDRYNDSQAVVQVIRPYALKAFIGNNQYLESKMKTNWQTMKLVKKRCYVGILRYVHHTLIQSGESGMLNH